MHWSGMAIYFPSGLASKDCWFSRQEAALFTCMLATTNHQIDLTRTIVAVGSGLAPARRAIVRISGSQTNELIGKLVGHLLPAQRASSFLCQADLGWGDRRLELNILFWPDHRSYTGEPSAELHLLGALPLVESLVERLIALGATPAQRGEFTLRSFLAGKLDLPQAEAVLGVIEADTTQQLTEALQQLGGNLSQPVRLLRDQLVALTAHLEAGLDFVEEDIEFISAEQLTADLQRIESQLEAISQQLQARSARSRTASLVLVGLPNSGKSSLFNALVGTERAIVSPQAGTTRDAVSATLKLGELPVELVDTAGMEELQTGSPRALAQGVLEERLRRADLALLCIDLHQPPDATWLRTQLARLQAMVGEVLLVGTKADLPHAVELAEHCAAVVSPFQLASIGSLRAHLAATLRNARMNLRADALHATAIRCRGSIEPAHHALQRAIELVAASGGEELVATELRTAIDELSAVIGDVHSEDILGQIFSRFCIGK